MRASLRASAAAFPTTTLSFANNDVTLERRAIRQKKEKKNARQVTHDEGERIYTRDGGGIHINNRHV